MVQLYNVLKSKQCPQPVQFHRHKMIDFQFRIIHKTKGTLANHQKVQNGLRYLLHMARNRFNRMLTATAHWLNHYEYLLVVSEIHLPAAIPYDMPKYWRLRGKSHLESN